MQSKRHPRRFSSELAIRPDPFSKTAAKRKPPRGHTPPRRIPVKTVSMKYRRQPTQASSGSSRAFDPKHEKVEVIQASKAVHGPEVYRMENTPRGICIIINNEEVMRHCRKIEAFNKDAEKMKSLFTKLNFDVTEKRNLTAGGILLELVNTCDSEDLECADCLVIIIISCGTKDVIYGTDGEELCLDSDVYPLFNEVNCPEFRGKPKLFFVQTCQNEHIKSRTKDGSCAVANEARMEYPASRWSNIYCAHGTIPDPGTRRWGLEDEDTKMRTGFLSAISSVFCQHAATSPLEDLMLKVNDEITQRAVTRSQKETLHIGPNSLTKMLYFNPGF